MRPLRSVGLLIKALTNGVGRKFFRVGATRTEPELTVEKERILKFERFTRAHAKTKIVSSVYDQECKLSITIKCIKVDYVYIPLYKKSLQCSTLISINLFESSKNFTPPVIISDKLSINNMHQFLDKHLCLETKVSRIILFKACFVNNYLMLRQGKSFVCRLHKVVDKIVSRKDIAAVATKFSFDILWQHTGL